MLSSWEAIFQLKKVVRRYRNWFGVDWERAFIELEMLGVEIDPSYKREVIRDARKLAAANRRRKVEREVQLEPLVEQDEFFAYIAGYTPAGFPFGLTWEVWDRIGDGEYSSSE